MSEIKEGLFLENGELTEKDYWDSRWNRIRLPAEVKKETAKSTTRELMKIFAQYLPQKEGLTILEIGGAPGKWLAYFKKNFHYDVHAIDYSEIFINTCVVYLIVDIIIRIGSFR